ncbi:hypothetical protein SELMODRAFT_422679 [Selaginella moellendorffii]|uniref:Uncharacterized protein n=1 Tax=Selaginella moellendorffii TaxID=88036 RepID=D8SJ70_SELML|nr:hypothetical protein SELMODRAFT_422679 [Selaginella moellendorffii]
MIDITDYSTYDKQLGVSVGPTCKQALQEITRLTEHGLVENAMEIKYLFGFSLMYIIDDTLLDYVANSAAMYESYNMQYGKTDGLCDPLLKAEKSSRNLLKTYAKILDRINSDNSSDTNDNERDNESWDFNILPKWDIFKLHPIGRTAFVPLVSTHTNITVIPSKFYVPMQQTLQTPQSAGNWQELMFVHSNVKEWLSMKA